MAKLIQYFIHKPAPSNKHKAGNLCVHLKFKVTSHLHSIFYASRDKLKFERRCTTSDKNMQDHKLCQTVKNNAGTHMPMQDFSWERSHDQAALRPNQTDTHNLTSAGCTEIHAPFTLTEQSFSNTNLRINSKELS